MKDVKVYSVGMCNLSACASKDLSPEEVASEVNAQHPTGLDHGWHLSEDKTFRTGEPMPCPCNDEPTSRLHYLFNC